MTNLIAHLWPLFCLIGGMLLALAVLLIGCWVTGCKR